MSILHVSPDAPFYIRAGANAVLALHIGGGLTGIVSGTVAAVARKGEWLHRTAGKVFVVSMLIMATIGAVVSPFLDPPQMINVIAGIFTFYLVLSAWVTVQRKEGTIGTYEYGAFAVVIGAVIADVALGWRAANHGGAIGGEPPQSYYVIGAMAVLAAVMDVKVLWRGGISGAQRIARHLWRMCAALFIAAGSFFLGQSQLFPKFPYKMLVLLVPELLILGLLIFWMLRVLLGRRFKEQAA